MPKNNKTQQALSPHKEDIFKIQKSMGNSRIVLIYNKAMDVYAQIPITPEIATIMGTMYKIYVKAYIDNDGILQILNVMNYQPW